MNYTDTSPQLCNSGDSSDSDADDDDNDNSNNDWQPDGDLSVNDVVQVANESGPDETTRYREEPDFSMLEHEEDGKMISAACPNDQ